MRKMSGFPRGSMLGAYEGGSKRIEKSTLDPWIVSEPSGFRLALHIRFGLSSSEVACRRDSQRTDWVVELILAVLALRLRQLLPTLPLAVRLFSVNCRSPRESASAIVTRP